MWVSDDGRLNTVALPDPSHVMTEEFRRSLEALAENDPESVAEAIEDAEDAVYDRDWSGLIGAEDYVGAPPPTDILRGSINTTSDLSDALLGVDGRWRLDAIVAVIDYLDQD